MTTDAADDSAGQPILLGLPAAGGQPERGATSSEPGHRRPVDGVVCPAAVLKPA